MQNVTTILAISMIFSHIHIHCKFL